MNGAVHEPTPAHLINRRYSKWVLRSRISTRVHRSGWVPFIYFVRQIDDMGTIVDQRDLGNGGLLNDEIANPAA
jgi:hypothetical protein